MLLVTSLVGLLMLYVLPNRQEAALEKSMRDELSSLAVAYSLSVRSALEQENLSALSDLNEQIKTDARAPIIAVLSDEADQRRIFAAFPSSEELASVAEIYSPRFLSAEQNFTSDIFDGTVVVMFERGVLKARLWSLNQPLYFI